MSHDVHRVPGRLRIRSPSIDQSTNLHNGFSTGLVNPGGALTPTSIDHAAVGSSAAEGLIGVFGNNWLFFVPTEGPNEGEHPNGGGF